MFSRTRQPALLPARHRRAGVWPGGALDGGSCPTATFAPCTSRDIDPPDPGAWTPCPSAFPPPPPQQGLCPRRRRGSVCSLPTLTAAAGGRAPAPGSTAWEETLRDPSPGPGPWGGCGQAPTPPSAPLHGRFPCQASSMSRHVGPQPGPCHPRSQAWGDSRGRHATSSPHCGRPP